MLCKESWYGLRWGEVGAAGQFCVPREDKVSMELGWVLVVQTERSGGT